MAGTLKKALKDLMIQDAPAYANKFFYSLGFLSATSFIMLIISGTIMSIMGQNWWLTSGAGQYLRSVHMWSTQAFVLFIVLHMLIVFFTSGFKKPRRLTWVLGVLMLLFVMAETEFGYVLRGDFSSQWRSLQGADFYNGNGLGYWLNSLNYKQIYGIHIVAIPFVIIGLLLLHYLLVRVLGIAKPYRPEVSAKLVPANHQLLFARGGGLFVMILVLAAILPSPYLKSITIQEVAKQSPNIVATTLVKEFDGTSDTAGYQDNIAPYTYSTRAVYIYAPYAQILQARQPGTTDQVAAFRNESAAVQAQQLKAATTFFDKWDGTIPINTTNPVILTVETLVGMAQSGLYEPALTAANDSASAGSSTYVLRFLSDSAVLQDKATSINLTTQQYGMLREEGGHAPGAWWLAPIGVLNHTVLSSDANGDRDASIIFGSFFLLLIAFPFIPYLNQLPDKLKVYKLIWHQKKQPK
jgi:ubiquinol-cytochrome c reductase cytochrome b subunit